MSNKGGNSPIFTVKLKLSQGRKRGDEFYFTKMLNAKIAVAAHVFFCYFSFAPKEK